MKDFSISNRLFTKVEPLTVASSPSKFGSPTVFFGDGGYTGWNTTGNITVSNSTC